jgi:hypothetical protein
VTQFAGMLLAGASSALPMALLMDGLAAALALSAVALLPRR